MLSCVSYCCPIFYPTSDIAPSAMYALARLFNVSLLWITANPIVKVPKKIAISVWWKLTKRCCTFLHHEDEVIFLIIVKNKPENGIQIDVHSVRLVPLSTHMSHDLSPATTRRQRVLHMGLHIARGNRHQYFEKGGTTSLMRTSSTSAENLQLEQRGPKWLFYRWRKYFSCNDHPVWAHPTHIFTCIH